MKNHEEETRQLKRWTLLHYFIIATIILIGGFLIGEQTHQLRLSGQFVAFLLVAGFVCIPMVYQVSRLRLEKFKKYQVTEVASYHTVIPENVDNYNPLNNRLLGTAPASPAVP